MGEIEWAMWANEQTIVSAVLLFIGGIIGVVRTPLVIFKWWEMAAYTIPASIFIFLFEYPRGKRKKGRTIERRFQAPITRVVAALRPVSTNYWVRFVLYLLMSVPTCFLLPTIMGGLSLQLSAIIYLVAAIKGEEWAPVLPPKKPDMNSMAITEPPSHPPPRGPRRDASEIKDPEANRY